LIGLEYIWIKWNGMESNRLHKIWNTSFIVNREKGGKRRRGRGRRGKEQEVKQLRSNT